MKQPHNMTFMRLNDIDDPMIYFFTLWAWDNLVERISDEYSLK